jgi:hypothetical protein
VKSSLESRDDDAAVESVDGDASDVLASDVSYSSVRHLENLPLQPGLHVEHDDLSRTGTDESKVAASGHGGRLRMRGRSAFCKIEAGAEETYLGRSTSLQSPLSDPLALYAPAPSESFSLRSSHDVVPVPRASGRVGETGDERKFER